MMLKHHSCSSSFNYEYFYIHTLSIYHFGLEKSLQWRNNMTEDVRVFSPTPFLFSSLLLFHLTTDRDFKLSLSPRVELRFKHSSSVIEEPHKLHTSWLHPSALSETFPSFLRRMVEGVIHFTISNNQRL